jgi:anti-anti-sigma factor
MRRRTMSLRRRLVLSPAGELDLLTTPRLRCALLDAVMVRGHRDITLDLRDVTFADARFVGAVVEASLRLRRRGGRLHIVNAHGTAALVLELSGIPFRPLPTPARARRACPYRHRR